MKINERVFERLDKEPFEVQTLEKRTVELFYLDDYPDLLDEYTMKGKFAVWSSVDGTNYRLAIEKEYYLTLQDLYGKKVNTIWTDFWDDCQKDSSNYTRFVILPGAIIFLLSIILFNVLLKSKPNIANIITVVLGVVYLLVVIIFRKITTNKLNMHNDEALKKIKAYLGANRFEELLDAQRKYIDDYTQKLIDEADKLDAEFEANVDALDLDENENSETKELEEVDTVDTIEEEKKED